MHAASDRFWVVLAAIVIEGGLIVAAEALGWLLGRPPRELFHWDWLDVWWGIGATVPMLLVFLIMLHVPIGPLRRIKQISQDVLVPMLAPCTTLDLLGISILAGLGEEMFFRGVLQGGIAGRLGLWPAFLIASTLFGVLHAITFTYAVFAALMGAYLGWVWLASDNLLPPALAHALYDFIALLYLVRGASPSRQPDDDVNG